MQPITRPSLSALMSELNERGWRKSGRFPAKPPFALYHPTKHSKLAAVVQQLPSGKAHAHFQANW